MHRTVKAAVFGVVALLLLAGTAAAALPGPQRALCPQCFGLTDIGDDVFIDNPARAVEIRNLIAAARQADSAFFGLPLQARPRILVCTEPACNRAFGGGTRAKGMTYGHLLIRFGPSLLTERIFAHELMHAELAYGTPWFGLAHPFPAWFNEGLAVNVSRDARYPGAATADEIAWIRGAISSRDWLRFAGGSGRAYEATRTAVGEIAADIGSDGLVTLITRVKAGEDFGKVLDDLERSAVGG